MARRRIPRRASAFAAAAAALTLLAGPLAQAADLPVAFVSADATEINVDPPADGYVGPGDVVALTPTIRNNAGRTLSGLTGRLILPDDGSILQNDTTFGTVAAGATRAAQTPFQVALVTGRECGRPLRFRMSVRSGDDSLELPFSVPTGAPGVPETFDYRGLPTTVSPGSQVSSSLTVPPIGLAKTVKVVVDRLDAARLGEISLTLRAPTGDEVPLAIRKGGDATALSAATFAATGDPLPSTHAPGDLSGSFTAEGDLGVLDGANTGGTWQLLVGGTSSARASDVLGDWSLLIAPAICQPQMIASITADQSVVSVGGTVSFDARDSVSPEHPITKYEWDLDGDGQWDPGVTSDTPSHVYAQRGAVDVRLRVSDDFDHSVTTSHLVSVTERPTAALTTSPATNVTAGEPITLDATGSAADPDGRLERYEWDLNGDGLYEVDGRGTPTLTTHFDTDGAHTVGVRVTDDARAPATATATFTVDDRPPDVALAVPQPAVVGVPATFDASATTDLERDQLSYAWDPEDDGSFVAGSDTRAVTFATPGLRHVSVRVGDGTLTTTRRMAVVVTSAPTADLAAPGTARPGQVVTLDASASDDAEGPIARYEWDLDANGSFERDTGSAASTTISWPDPGVQTVRVRVTDGDGATSASSATVTVVNQTPLAVLTASPTSPLTNQEVVFSAVGSADPDGTVDRFDWDLDGNGSFETAGEASPTLRRSFPNALDLRPRVRVTDNEGGVGVALVLLHVTAPPVAASPVTPVTPAAPAPALLPGGSGAAGGGTGAGGAGSAGAAGGGTGPKGTSGSAGATGGAAAGAAGPPAFAAGLAGATVQRSKAVRNAGVRLSCRADRSVTCALTAVVAAREAKRLHLVEGKHARAFTVGVRTVRTKGSKASATAFRLPRPLARLVAAGTRAVVLVTGTATDARGRRVALRRSVTLRR